MGILIQIFWRALPLAAAIGAFFLKSRAALRLSWGVVAAIVAGLIADTLKMQSYDALFANGDCTPLAPCRNTVWGTIAMVVLSLLGALLYFTAPLLLAIAGTIAFFLERKARKPDTTFD